MLDYSKITEEEITKRTLNMPASLKGVYESPEFGFSVMKIADENFLEEEEAQTLLMLVGLYLMGFMKEQDLSEEISRELYLDPEESDKMVEKIRDLVRARLNPSSASLRTSFSPPSIPKPASPLAYQGGPVFNESPDLNSPAPAKVKIDFGGAPATPAPQAAPKPATPSYTPTTINPSIDLKTKSVVSSPDIHPENIIDLKDLPR